VPGFDVVTLGKGGKSFRFGTVIGDYEFHHEDEKTPHRRAVKWRRESIEKTAATEELFSALNCNLTIWRISNSKGFGPKLHEAL
jgi:predicted Mrr-cat superfamily restriction endonuclease